MRVLQVDSGREWRGGQNQVRLLARELARAPGLAQRLVTRRGGELARQAAAQGVAVAGASWTIAFDPRAWWRLVHEASAFRPDVIHAHDSHALQLALWARRWLRGAGRAPRVIATRRVDFHVRPGGPWFHADRVIAVSKAVRAVLVADGLPASRITVVPDGVDPEEIRRAAAAPPPLGVRRRLGLADGTPLALNVAALVDHKDQRTLVRAAQAARALRPDLHWAIAGEGRLRGALLREIRARNLADRVHLLGFIEEVDALIREADVFVMSSKEEGLGSVMLEALVLEKPVVATRGGGLPELVPAEWLVPVGDAEALARVVLRALDHPSPFPLPQKFTALAMAEGVLATYRALA